MNYSRVWKLCCHISLNYLATPFGMTPRIHDSGAGGKIMECIPEDISTKGRRYRGCWPSGLRFIYRPELKKSLYGMYSAVIVIPGRGTAEWSRYGFEDRWDMNYYYEWYSMITSILKALLLLYHSSTSPTIRHLVDITLGSEWVFV
jgi:hypothetical protein